MKMLLSLKLWLAVCLFAVSTVSSAGIIWETSDGDSDFISFSAASFPFPSSDIFGIFSANAVVGTDAPIATFTGVGNFSSTSPFKLGMKIGSSWVSEVGSTSLVNDDDYVLVFSAPAPLGNNLHYLYGFDIKPSANQDGSSPVPLPASVWMMTSALLGVLYMGRRKSSIYA